MSYLLEILGRGLLSELAAAFRDVLADDAPVPTSVLRATARRHPGRSGAQRTLGIRLLREQQPEAAIEAFEAALASAPDDDASRIGIACGLDASGRTAEALALIESFVDYECREPHIYFAVGFCHEKLGAVERALTAYEQALELAPELRNAHERLAAIYLRRDEPKPALAHYEHLCWCDPGDLSLHLTLGALYALVGRHEDATRQFEHATTLDPDRWDSLDDVIDHADDDRRIDEAIALAERAIEAQPEQASQHVCLGNLLSRTGRTARALTCYEQAIKLNPNCLEAAVKIGSLQLSAGDYDAAAKAFSAAIEINDRLVDAYVGLGVSQQACGSPGDAVASFDAAAMIEPNSDLLFSEMAKLQLRVSAAEQRRQHMTVTRTSDSNGADRDHGDVVDPLVRVQIDNLRAGIAAHPAHADLHYRLGVLLRHAGDGAGAIRAFAEAVAINPHYIKALVRLGLTLRDAGDTRGAIRAFERALELDQESIDLHYQLGLMFADEGQFAAALDRFEYATKHDPHNEAYLANLALALQNMGLLDRASATWQTLCNMTADRAGGALTPPEATRSRFA